MSSTEAESFWERVQQLRSEIYGLEEYIIHMEACGAPSIDVEFQEVELQRKIKELDRLFGCQ